MIEKVIKVIELIKEIRQWAEENNQLDEQWYLNFLDDINKLSIDQDR